MDDAAEQFFKHLAHGIIVAGGDQFTEESALVFAKDVWQALKEVGTDAFPCMTEKAGLRFVFQWDEEPQVLTVMMWDDELWRNMARITVPAELV